MSLNIKIKAENWGSKQKGKSYFNYKKLSGARGLRKDIKPTFKSEWRFRTKVINMILKSDFENKVFGYPILRPRNVDLVPEKW